MATAPEVEYEPALVEAAVLAAVTGRLEERQFRHERDPLYEVDGSEAREATFAALHARWLARLGLDQPLRRALAEHPAISARCGRVVVAQARTAPQEGADLRVAPPAPPTLLILLSPATLADPGRLETLLARELLHVADMLDPAFGYEPRPSEGGATAPVRLLAERYRVLWDAWVDGRLLRRGKLPPAARRTRLADFVRAFPALEEGVEAAFERFFGAERCTHADLLAFAASAAPVACPLCGLPAGAWTPAPERLAPPVLAAIRREFPAWSPAAGLCRRCAEVYACRAAAAVGRAPATGRSRNRRARP